MTDNEVLSLLCWGIEYSRKERKATSILSGSSQEALQRITYIRGLKDRFHSGQVCHAEHVPTHQVRLLWPIQSSHLKVPRFNLKAPSPLSPHLILTLWAAGAGELFPSSK